MTVAIVFKNRLGYFFKYTDKKKNNCKTIKISITDSKLNPKRIIEKYNLSLNK